jgi:hypothetical protein
MHLKKNQAEFLSINTFPPKQTPFLLDLSVLIRVFLQRVGTSVVRILCALAIFKCPFARALLATLGIL